MSYTKDEKIERTAQALTTLKGFVEDGRVSPNEIVDSLNTRLMVLEAGAKPDEMTDEDFRKNSTIMAPLRIASKLLYEDAEGRNGMGPAIGRAARYLVGVGDTVLIVASYENDLFAADVSQIHDNVVFVENGPSSVKAYPWERVRLPWRHYDDVIEKKPVKLAAENVETEKTSAEFVAQQMRDQASAFNRRADPAYAVLANELNKWAGELERALERDDS